MKTETFVRIARLFILLMLFSLQPAAVRAQAVQPAEQPPAGAQPQPAETADQSAAAEIQSPESDQPGFQVKRAGQDLVVFGRDVVLKAGETSRDMVVIGGSATVDGTVDGDLVVLFGSATVNGTVDGEMVVVLGSGKLGPDAEVKRDACVIGGQLDAKSGQIGGERTEIGLGVNWPSLNWFKDWLSKGLLLGRPLPHQLGWWWGVAAILLALNIFIAAVLRRPVQATVQTLESNAIASFFVGLLFFLLIGPLLLLLCVSVAGVVVIPFLFCAVIVALLLGKVAVYQHSGIQLGRQLGLQTLELPLVGVIVGTALFYLVYMVPFVGFIVWGILVPMRLGSVLLALFRSVRPPNGKPTAEPVPLSTSVAHPVSTSSVVEPTSSSPPAASELVLAPRVGFWLRFWATAIDFLLIGLLTALTTFPPFGVLLWVIYHLGMWAWKGTTIGGIILGIKIVRMNGQPIDFGIAVVRSLSSILSAAVLFLGFFWAGWDREKQAWHDKIAGTVVVRVPKGFSLV